MRCIICDFNEDTGSGLLEFYTKDNKVVDDLCTQCANSITEITVHYTDENTTSEGEVENLIDEPDTTQTHALPGRHMSFE